MNEKLVLAIAMISVLVPTLSVSSKAQIAQTTGIIYINADGSIYPPTGNITTTDNITYTFTGNVINESIVVQRDNIVIDGAGYTLQGTGSGNGISLASINNVTIRNTTITCFAYAISLSSSSDNTLSDNNMTGNVFLTPFTGIFGYTDVVYIESSNNNTVSGNSIIENGGNFMFSRGIYLKSSSYNTVSGNTVTGNDGDGITFTSCIHNIVSDNNISRNNGYGIDLDLSSNNIVSDNNISRNGGYDTCGIELMLSPNNTVSNNSVSGNSAGISLDGSSNNTLSYNNITKGSLTHTGASGIELDLSSNDAMLGNNIIGYPTGVYLFLGSRNNVVSGNNIIGNGEGIYLDSSVSVCYNNSIYHNDFVDNSKQAVLSDPEPNSALANAWDADYPSGGNYWSDYNGTDLYSGIYQNESGFDWVGDSSYVIDQNNIDRYPLMNPYSSETGGIELAYRSLLMKSNLLQTSLDANISDLQEQVNTLNSTANYLKTEVDNLTFTLNQTSTGFQGQIGSLGNTITGLQAQINSLNSTLQTSTSNTQKQYNSLNSQLDTISKTMYLLATMTAVLIVTEVYISVRKPKQKRLQLT